ncbi:hypothetical protein FD720_04575 [Photobacterium damselae subsp. damselae]|nr:hypothetical protein FD721_07595 [Photobacterium damselae subsp. damselae]TLS88667.1 hypothetical protein FD720_04575 [Photobacterium damselae subsp. damselae]
MGGISVAQLLIIGVICVLVFGTKKLRTVGSDLGYALRDPLIISPKHNHV